MCSSDLLAVEFVSRVSLSEIAKILLEGAAYDLLKSGTALSSCGLSWKPTSGSNLAEKTTELALIEFDLSSKTRP